MVSGIYKRRSGCWVCQLILGCCCFQAFSAVRVGKYVYAYRERNTYICYIQLLVHIHILLPSLYIEDDMVYFSFPPFYTYNFFHRLWETWLPLSSNTYLYGQSSYESNLLTLPGCQRTKWIGTPFSQKPPTSLRCCHLGKVGLPISDFWS